MELTKYSWWGSSNEPPEHLKTKKQLAELGLSPLQPAGVIETRKYDLLLYDINNPECCRPKRKSTCSPFTSANKTSSLPVAYPVNLGKKSFGETAFPHFSDAVAEITAFRGHDVKKH